MNPAFIPKDDLEIPDYYGIKIFYHGGLVDEFQGSHHFVKETNSYDILTKDDIWENIPLSSIRKIQFDKNFSKIMALVHKKKLRERTKENTGIYP